MARLAGGGALDSGAMAHEQQILVRGQSALLRITRHVCRVADSSQQDAWLTACRQARNQEHAECADQTEQGGITRHDASRSPGHSRRVEQIPQVGIASQIDLLAGLLKSSAPSLLAARG